ncbi:MAG: ISKra4 family transposase [Burkholderiales bacterium]
MHALAEVGPAPLGGSQACFESLRGYLHSPEAMGMRHSDLERELEARGRELLRRMLQEHLDWRSPGFARQPVRAADGVARPRQRVHARDLQSVFGTVQVTRVGYGAAGTDSLHPLDAELNLAPQRYSHELARRVAEEVAKTSFEETVRSLEQQTGAPVPKRQVEELARRAAQDFDTFYAQRRVATVPATSALLVTTMDGKGVVMRREDLRAPTRQAAQRRVHKLRQRLSKGEKRNAKRMATVAAVYTIAPVVRAPEDIVRGLTGLGLGDHAEPPHAPRPRPEHKRVWASVEQSPEQVIEEIFHEAARRDPGREKTWVALVDGNATQLRLLHQRSTRLGVALTIVLDIVHVAQYLWAAALAFHAEGSAERELWVATRLAEILRGRASVVAAAMRRSATRRGLMRAQRKAVDKCAGYLLRHKAYLHYDVYLAAGLPVATGVIEGACRHVVKDRMDITGARWSLAGAEAVLRLRALRASGDFDEYWPFHEDQEYRRHHVARYADGGVPATETPRRDRNQGRTHLRIAK